MLSKMSLTPWRGGAGVRHGEREQQYPLGVLP